MPFKTSKIGLSSRKAAWDVLKFVAAGAYADVALDRVLKRFDFDVVDRSLVMEIAYGAIRQRYMLDRWIDFYGKVPAVKQPPHLRWLLHIGLYQLLLMERIPCSAAVDTTVELAKTSSLSRLAPVVNAVLRSILRAKEEGIGLPLPESPAARLAQNHSLPLWFAKDLISWIGQERSESVAQASNQVPPIDLRVNRILASPEALKKRFESEGIECVHIDGCPYGLQVKSGAGDLREWPGYTEGHWCVQDRAAQWVSPLLNPKPGERILDACSAPGGKATHLAELMDNKGELWAVDRSKDRLKRVTSNADRLRCNCLNVLEADASSLLEVKPEWNRSFQGILLDAPCSGLGTLARHPDARWRMSPEKISGLVALQFKLFERLLPLLCKGGRILYSTCTIHPEENEKQIHRILNLHPELKLEKEKQLWPDISKVGDGFYAAIVQFV